MKTDARRFEIMSLYLNNDALLEYKIDSFRKFLQNSNALPDTHRTQNYNFVLTLRKVTNPNLKWHDSKIEKIIEDVKIKPTSETVWLIGQLQKLKRKKQ